MALPDAGWLNAVGKASGSSSQYPLPSGLATIWVMGGVRAPVRSLPKKAASPKWYTAPLALANQ